MHKDFVNKCNMLEEAITEFKSGEQLTKNYKNDASLCSAIIK